MENKIIKSIESNIISITKSVGENTPTKIKFKLSVEKPDRNNDIVKIDGISLDNYKLNPVVLFNHDPTIPPIGIGEDLHVDNGVLFGTIVFHRKTQLSNELADLAEEGIMRAVSIGFIPLEYKDITITDEMMEQESYYPTIPTSRVYDKSEMLEFSLVSLPANQYAVIQNSFTLKDIMKYLSTKEDMEVLYSNSKEVKNSKVIYKEEVIDENTKNEINKMEELKKIIEALNNAIGILNEIINEPSPEDGEPKEDINEPSPEDMDKTIDDEDVVNKQEEDIEIFTAEIQKTILDNIKNYLR